MKTLDSLEGKAACGQPSNHWMPLLFHTATAKKLHLAVEMCLVKEKCRCGVLRVQCILSLSARGKFISFAFVYVLAIRCWLSFLGVYVKQPDSICIQPLLPAFSRFIAMKKIVTSYVTQGSFTYNITKKIKNKLKHMSLQRGQEKDICII